MEKDILIRTRQIQRFFDDYPDVFTPIEQEMVLEYASRRHTDKFVPDVIREVYDELGLLSDDQNIYIGFLNLLRKQYNIPERRIIEVGGGVLPRLGKRISRIQTTGHITVYDPRLSRYEEDTSHLTLSRRRFSSDMSVGKADLIIGLMPCEGAQTVIESATDHGIDFMLAFCEGGPHGDEFDFYEDEEEWLNSMLCLARYSVEEKKMGKLKVKHLREYGDPYPVIYNSHE